MKKKCVMLTMPSEYIYYFQSAFMHPEICCATNKKQLSLQNQLFFFFYRNKKQASYHTTLGIVPPNKQNSKSTFPHTKKNNISYKNNKTCSEEETRIDNMSGNIFHSSIRMQLMWRSEIFSESFKISCFNVCPLIYFPIWGKFFILSPTFQ